MCVPILAQVISLEAEAALVESDGFRVAVGCPMRPDVQPGDWVLIYLGQIVSRVSRAEAGALQELLQALKGP